MLSPRHHVTMRRTVTTALLAAAVLPAAAACSASGGSTGASASASVGRSGGQVSVSVSPPSVSPPSVSPPAVTGSAGPLTVGQDVTLTGSVSKVLAPGGFLFLMTRSGGAGPVAVGSLTPTGVKAGQPVTVSGTVADVDVPSLVKQFGSRLPADARAQLRQLKGASFVNASSVRSGG
jgi:hypothetical protein